MKARHVKSTRHSFISWALLFISYYYWEDGLNCFSNGLWISYPPPTCFVCLIKYLVLSFLVIIRQSKSKKETLREENIQMKFKTSIFETENMRTSIHPRQFRSIWHLVHLTESILRNQKHPPPTSISEDLAYVIQKNCYKKLSAQSE